MNRLGHQCAAQAAWLAVAGHQGYAPAEVITGAIVASAMCADDWSPDSDQGGWVAKVVPGGHRGLLHMPEVALGLIWLTKHFTEGRGYDWFWQATAVAWLTHLAIDLPWGKIPFLIFGGHRVGFKLKTGGPTERAVTFLLAAASMPLAWQALMPP
jgi:membrane-bound metal-dependent hydrolase YbcI (DUF457 family)